MFAAVRHKYCGCTADRNLYRQHKIISRRFPTDLQPSVRCILGGLDPRYVINDLRPDNDIPIAGCDEAGRGPLAGPVFAEGSSGWASPWIFR